MLKKIFIGLVILIVLLILGAFLLPSKVHVERSVKMDASAATVFAMVDGFKGFNRWSPWADLDPNTEITFEGPDNGVGAKMTWKSENPKVGSGSQEITDSIPDERVDVHLDFGKQGVAESYFQLNPDEGITKVTWGLDIDLGMNPIARYMGLTFDKMIGPDYEKGLNKLKTLAESIPKVDFSGLEVEIIDVEPVTYAYVSSSGTDNESVSRSMSEAFERVMAFLTAKDIKASGPPISVWTSMGKDEMTFDAGFPIPVESEFVDEETDVKVGVTSGGKCIHLTHLGSYYTLGETYQMIHAYIMAYGYETSGPDWAQYTNDPSVVPEEEWETQIYFPIK